MKSKYVTFACCNNNGQYEHNLNLHKRFHFYNKINLICNKVSLKLLRVTVFHKDNLQTNSVTYHWCLYHGVFVIQMKTQVQDRNLMLTKTKTALILNQLSRALQNVSFISDSWFVVESHGKHKV